MSDTTSATDGCQHEWMITYPFDGGDSRTDRPAISVCKKCGKKVRGIVFNTYKLGDLKEIFSDMLLKDLEEYR